jgi:hypothetical protein
MSWKAHQTDLYLSFSGGGVGLIAEGVRIREDSEETGLLIFSPSCKFSLTFKLLRRDIELDNTPRGPLVRIRFDGGVLGLALRKGYAFPGQLPVFSPHSRRLEGYAFGGANEVDESSRRRKGVAFPHSKRRSRRSALIYGIVIWTSMR